MVTVSKPRCGCCGKPGTTSPWYMRQPSLPAKSCPMSRPASDASRAEPLVARRVARRRGGRRRGTDRASASGDPAEQRRGSDPPSRYINAIQIPWLPYCRRSCAAAKAEPFQAIRVGMLRRSARRPTRSRRLPVDVADWYLLPAKLPDTARKAVPKCSTKEVTPYLFAQVVMSCRQSSAL